MAPRRCSGLVLALCFLYVSAKSVDPHPSVDGAVVASSKTTTHKPITTTAPPTTEHTSPTTTVPPFTTTPTTNGTTTIAPPPTNGTTTVPPFTTSSTSAPTTQSPTTTSPPGPSSTTTSKPSEDLWVVTDNNVNCILAKMKITLKIKHNSTNHKDLILYNGLKGINVSGSCGPNMNSLVLGLDKNVIAFDFFLKTGSTKHYFVSNITVDLDPSILNMTDKDLIHMSYKGEEFLTQVNNSFECSSPSPSMLDNTLGWEASEIQLSDVTLEAFRNSTGKTFSAPVNCVMVVPDIVPIVVGCILALLVVIILVGYLIGRKRSQSRGYTSM